MLFVKDKQDEQDYSGLCEGLSNPVRQNTTSERLFMITSSVEKDYFARNVKKIHTIIISDKFICLIWRLVQNVTFFEHFIGLEFVLALAFTVRASAFTEQYPLCIYYSVHS